MWQIEGIMHIAKSLMYSLINSWLISTKMQLRFKYILNTNKFQLPTQIWSLCGICKDMALLQNVGVVH
jgi:hypothetical protein